MRPLAGVGVAGTLMFIGFENGFFANDVDHEKFANNLTTQTDSYFSGNGFDTTKFITPDHDIVSPRSVSNGSVDHIITSVQGRAGWEDATPRQKEIAACGTLAVTLAFHNQPLGDNIKNAYNAPATPENPHSDELGAKACTDRLAQLVTDQIINKIYYVEVVARDTD
ncbi:MAG TPA: hypothetical protein VF733_01335 [Candidatus Saccharimonadales bacterium]